MRKSPKTPLNIVIVHKHLRPVCGIPPKVQRLHRIDHCGVVSYTIFKRTLSDASLQCGNVFNTLSLRRKNPTLGCTNPSFGCRSHNMDVCAIDVIDLSADRERGFLHKKRFTKQKLELVIERILLLSVLSSTDYRLHSPRAHALRKVSWEERIGCAPPPGSGVWEHLAVPKWADARMRSISRLGAGGGGAPRCKSTILLRWICLLSALARRWCTPCDHTGQDLRHHFTLFASMYGRSAVIPTRSASSVRMVREPCMQSGNIFSLRPILHPCATVTSRRDVTKH